MQRARAGYQCSISNASGSIKALEDRIRRNKEVIINIFMMHEAIAKCIKVSKKGDMNQHHGAIIIRQGCHLVTGHNYYESTRSNKSVHAEVDAIREFKKRYPKSWLRTSVMIVIRANKHEDLLNSAPCAACQKYIKKHGIPATYFSS